MNTRGIRRILYLPLVLLFAFVMGAGQSFYDDIIKPRINPASPTIRPTFTYAAPLPTVGLPTATPNPCTPAARVTPASEGKTICVYGQLIRQQFLPYNRTVRLYLSESPPFFFLCENCYYDVNPGDCITANGSIQLTTDDQPFINLHGGRLASCQ